MARGREVKGRVLRGVFEGLCLEGIEGVRELALVSAVGVGAGSLVLLHSITMRNVGQPGCTRSTHALDVTIFVYGKATREHAPCREKA